MNEDTIRREVSRVLFAWGFDDYHPPDQGPTELGRPDIYGLNPIDATIVVEVKKMDEKVRIDPWIPFSIISNKQRRWLDWWCWDREAAGFLAIGTTFGKPRRLWIIPWKRYVAYEKWKSPDGSDGRIELSDLEKFFSNTKENYELKWLGKGDWELPFGHPITAIPVRMHTENDWKTVHSYRFEENKKQ